MSETISIRQIQKLRKEFREYLRSSYPKWDDSVISTHVSEAFFAFNNNIGVDFWSCLLSEESLLEASDRIREYFLDKKKYDDMKHEDIDARVEGCSSSLRFLKKFLDEKYPALAKDWSGKAINTGYLKADFQAWMQTQKKDGKEPYSPKTIRIYAKMLEEGTAYLSLNDEVNPDLFYYTTWYEFEEAKKAINAALNSAEIDFPDNLNAYKNAIYHYSRFLEESGRPSCWIFQGNPKYYDVSSAVESLDIVTWPVNQYSKQIKKGDRAYIWLSGSDGGVIASGTVLCDPEMREPAVDDAFNRRTPLKDKTYLAVDISLERKFTEKVVRRSVLLADERTKRLEILTYPGATNFRVAKEQEDVIESILDGSYDYVPAISAPTVEVTEKERYWIYSPGYNASFWDEFSQAGIMGITWDELGDLRQYATKKEIKAAMKKIWGDERDYRNDGHAAWQFANELSRGDIVFAKRGVKWVIGRGIVESEYIFDASRSKYKHIHKVRWTHRDEREHPGPAVTKMLTDITPYTNYVQKLEFLFSDETVEAERKEDIKKFDEYSKEDFLEDVYMSERRYEALKNLLLRKKNVILQGAPGVGKTFTAKRLAFSIMGEKDVSRIKTVQFHQNYSYEDFIRGYRPDGTGFHLASGPFYEFCKEAETDDDDREYFFIIDEINRGNLSKIFGELLTLIEKDKRGRNHSVRLLYDNEQFFVPDNVYIIGMMNTADRSLAMIDYALRRRFAFFEMEPAFASARFRTYQMTIQNDKFNALIGAVEKLNKFIADDASLGNGFRIGHSYFDASGIVDDAWLSGVVEYELLPLLNEYWFDEPSKAEQWAKELRGAIL
jgi:MoxR-like ATPase